MNTQIFKLFFLNYGYNPSYLQKTYKSERIYPSYRPQIKKTRADKRIADHQTATSAMVILKGRIYSVFAFTLSTLLI